MSRPKVKICGLTTVEDVEAALALGADFVGLNFYEPSPRYVDLGTARRLRDTVGDRATVVGVFVNSTSAGEIADDVGLDLLQFHGDEGPAFVAEFAERAIKVFRVGERFDATQLEDYAATWGYLFDNGNVSARGGSGLPWSWELVSAVATDKPIFIAGGVSPQNVGSLCARVHPWGIDVCSGVEASKGRKDPALLQRLFQEIEDGEAQAAS